MIDLATLRKLNRLADAVAANELTQLEISKTTGIHQSQISRILDGQIKRESKNVVRLCKFVDLHINGEAQEVTKKLAPNRHDALARLFTDKSECDAALLEVLESLAKWRDTLHDFRG